MNLGGNAVFQLERGEKKEDPPVKEAKKEDPPVKRSRQQVSFFDALART